MSFPDINLKEDFSPMNYGKITTAQEAAVAYQHIEAKYDLNVPPPVRILELTIPGCISKAKEYLDSIASMEEVEFDMFSIADGRPVFYSDKKINTSILRTNFQNRVWENIDIATDQYLNRKAEFMANAKSYVEGQVKFNTGSGANFSQMASVSMQGQWCTMLAGSGVFLFDGDAKKLEDQLKEHNDSSRNWIGTVDNKEIIDLSKVKSQNKMLDKIVQDDDLKQEIRGKVGNCYDEVGLICDEIAKYLSTSEDCSPEDIKTAVEAHKDEVSPLSGKFVQEAEEEEKKTLQGSAAGMDKMTGWIVAELDPNWLDLEDNCKFGTMKIMGAVVTNATAVDVCKVLSLSLYKGLDESQVSGTSVNLDLLSSLTYRLWSFCIGIGGSMSEVTWDHLCKFVLQEIDFFKGNGVPESNELMIFLKNFADGKSEKVTVEQIADMRHHTMKKSEAMRLMKMHKDESDCSLIELFNKSTTEPSKTSSKPFNMKQFLSTIAAVSLPVEDVTSFHELDEFSDECMRDDAFTTELSEEKKKEISDILVNECGISRKESLKRVAEIGKTTGKLGLEHVLENFEGTTCQVLILFEDNRVPICIMPEEPSGSLTVVVKEGGQVELCFSCIDLDDFCDDFEIKSSSSGKVESPSEQKEREEHEKNFKGSLEKELKIIADKKLYCFYFGYPAKVTMEDQLFVFDYGASSGHDKWVASVSEIIKEMKANSEGLAVHSYVPSVLIPRHNLKEIEELMTKFHEDYVKGEKNWIWDRSIKKDDEETADGDPDKKTAKRVASNPITDTNKLVEHDKIILVNVETYLTIILCFAVCIQRFYMTVKLNFKGLTFEDLDWTAKNAFGKDHINEWNHIGRVYLACLRTSRQSGDIYQFPMYPRRNGLSNAGSSLTMVDYEPSMLYFTDDDKKLEVLMKLLKNYCQGDCPEKGVQLLNQYVLSKWNVDYHVLHRTHVGKNLFELIKIG